MSRVIKGICLTSLLIEIFNIAYAASVPILDDSEASFFGPIQLEMDYVDAGTINDAVNFTQNEKLGLHLNN